MALFAIDKGAAKKIPPNSMSPERSIQSLFERNLEEILDITFLASEYSTSWICQCSIGHKKRFQVADLGENHPVVLRS